MRSIITLLLVSHAWIAFAFDYDSIPLHSSDFAALIKAAREKGEERPTDALTYIEHALTLPGTDSTDLIKALLFKGEILNELGQSEEAVIALIPVANFNELPASKGTIATASSLLCDIYSAQGEFRKALKYGYKARLIFEENKAVDQYASLYNSLGYLYFKIENYEKAISFYKKSISYNDRNKGADIPNYFNLSLCYAEVDSLDNAFSAARKGLELCKDPCPQSQLVIAYFALGVVSLKKGDTQSSFTNFERSLALARALKRSPVIIDNLVMQGRAMTKLKEYDSALVLLNEAEKVSTETKCNKCLLNVYLNLVDAYEAKDMPKEQSDYLQKYIDMKDDMLNADLMRDLATVEGKHLEKEHMEQIAFQEKQLQAQEEVMHYQMIKAILIGLVCLLLLVLVFIQIRNVRMKKQIQQRLEAKVQERVKVLEEKRAAVLADQEKKRKVFEKFSVEGKQKLETINALLDQSEADAEIIEGIRKPVKKLYDYLSKIEKKEQVNNADESNLKQ